MVAENDAVGERAPLRLGLADRDDAAVVDLVGEARLAQAAHGARRRQAYRRRVGPDFRGVLLHERGLVIGGDGGAGERADFVTHRLDAVAVAPRAVLPGEAHGAGRLRVEGQHVGRNVAREALGRERVAPARVRRDHPLGELGLGARVLRIGLGARRARAAHAAHVRDFLAVRALHAQEKPGGTRGHGQDAAAAEASVRIGVGGERLAADGLAVRQVRGRIEGGEGHHAGKRIGAVDGGRWPAHDLHLPEQADAERVARRVGEAPHAVALGQADAVHRHLHAVALEAADVEVAEAEARGRTLDRHARLVADEVAQVARGLAEEVLAFDHAHRGRDRVDGLLDAAHRPHHLDLLDPGHRGGLRVGARGRGPGGCGSLHRRRRARRSGCIDLRHDAAHIEIQDVQLAGQGRVGPRDVDLPLVGGGPGQGDVQRNAPDRKGPRIRDAFAHAVVVHKAVEDGLGLLRVGQLPRLGQRLEPGEEALPARQVDDPREATRAPVAVHEGNAAKLPRAGARVDDQFVGGIVRRDAVAPVRRGRLESRGMDRGRGKDAGGDGQKKAGVGTPANREVHRTTLCETSWPVL